MKLNELNEALNDNVFIQIDIMRNPADLGEWVVWVRNESGKSDLLGDDVGIVIANRDIDQLILLLRVAGLKKAGIML